MKAKFANSLVLLALSVYGLGAATLYVSPAGNDANPGSRRQPLKTFAGAQKAVRALKAKSAKPITVLFREGTYYLSATIVFTPQDSGSRNAPVRYTSYPGETAVISGGTRLNLSWTPYRDGIMKARVPAGTDTDQLFINGERQHLARYPNYDPAARYFNGWAADAFSQERAARWADPRGGYIHVMHRHMWGSFDFVITGKDPDGNVTYEGGWQNNRLKGIHPERRFVENIFEELDAPGEWFLNKKTGTLYFYPPPGVVLNRATVEAVRLKHLIEFRGSERNPVKFLTLSGFTFRHSARTFMETREPLLRSDWTIYRGGAIFFTGCEDCILEDSFLDQLGGNAVLASAYNRRVAVRGCHIVRAGASGVAFVGSPEAVRSPLFEYEQRHSLQEIDRTPGPKTNNFPADCVVEDCLIHGIGRVEKQAAGVEISMAQDITVRHCSIYDTPRAGINIGDGTWGGHTIEFCDVFDTVLETGDHGSLNAWGRDRYWGLTDVDLNRITRGGLRDLPLLDTVKPVTIRNSRWRCDFGWDIDLDDGASNYRLYNNLCLNGGIKLREGFFRVCENNIMVNSSLRAGKWFRDSEDVVRRNIIFRPYVATAGTEKPFGREFDYQFLHKPGQKAPNGARELREQSGRDQHSIELEVRFTDAGKGDYRVVDGSPVLKSGFENFPMDRFGVQSPRLKAIARRPRLPAEDDAAAKTMNLTGVSYRWLGLVIKNVVGLDEMSAAGLPDETGVLVVEAAPGSLGTAFGIHAGDVILRFGGKPVGTVQQLQQYVRGFQMGEKAALTVYREQREKSLTIKGSVESRPIDPVAKRTGSR